MPPNFSSTANEIWAVADLLCGDFKQSQYGRIILPFALLRRLECVLASTKAAVLAKLPSVASPAWECPHVPHASIADCPHVPNDPNSVTSG